MPWKPDSDDWRVSASHSLSEIDAGAWDALGQPDYPFTRHAFLHGLELHDCLEPFGWHPVYFQLRQGGELLAAIPCYIKTNSYGELVFDHAWVNAYQRSGLDYYPKLVSAIPYTPATGDRFLIDLERVRSAEQRQALREHLCRAIQGFCVEQKLSSWHVLFAEREILAELRPHDLELRSDVQFHWRNEHYRDFDDFLAHLNSRKRKNIRRERRSVAEQGLDIRLHGGDELDASDWRRVYQLYAGIYRRKYGTPTLSEAFFCHLGATMPQRVLVTLARDQGRIVAASLLFRSDSHLYGRVWGCDDYYRDLHFECCYYRGIEYCITEGLACFDPGAQGEHKLSRGFLPTLTWSGHWIAHPEFRDAINRFLQHERRYIESYRDELLDHSPYRQAE